MKLANVPISEAGSFEIPYETQIEKIKKAGGKYIDAGDYGAVFSLNGKAVKVSTDPIEIEHAKKLEDQQTVNFVHIYKVEEPKPGLGVITMDLLKPYTGDIPSNFIAALEKEAEEHGIDPEELDIRKSNIMMSPKDDHLKMIDV